MKAPGKVGDPDPLGSALFLEALYGSAFEGKAGSGSALKIRSRRRGGSKMEP
jgi:hypothetical protein